MGVTVTAGGQKAIRWAAAELELFANGLRVAHTVDGDWRDEREAKREHDRLLRIASKLRGILLSRRDARPTP